HDTYFVVAHFHYVMVGGTLVAFLAALHHWWPKMFGRNYNEWCGRISAALVFLGFNLTFFSQFVMGSQGMPRRYASYDQLGDKVGLYTMMHQISTWGSMLLGIALTFTLFYLTYSLIWGKKVEKDEELPWTGESLEWKTTTPPLQHNFIGQPAVNVGPYEFAEIDRSRGDH
ncbi:MAG: cbb3-type cytochrome c oxidase subunit I, partial [Myxococcota bacterium]